MIYNISLVKPFFNLYVYENSYNKLKAFLSILKTRKMFCNIDLTVYKSNSCVRLRAWL